MLDSVRRFFSPLPSEHKAAFFRQAFGENISRLVLCSSLLIVAEGAIYLFFPGQILGTDRAIGFFVLGNLLGFPVLLLLYKRKNTLPLPVLHGAQLLYFLGTLAFSWALTLVPQPELVSINTYSIAVFAIAVFFVLPPLEGFLLYLFAYLGFYFLFPLYQTNPHIVLVLRINTFVMTLLAWVFGRVTFLLRLKNFIDRGTIEEANRRLKDLTIRDSMTGLFNHDHSFFNLEIEIERSKRFHRPLSVIMMDIDNFKSINDRFGHQAGDEVIIRVAEILKNDLPGHGRRGQVRRGGIHPDHAERGPGGSRDRGRTNPLLHRTHRPPAGGTRDDQRRDQRIRRRHAGALPRKRGPEALPGQGAREKPLRNGIVRLGKPA